MFNPQYAKKLANNLENSIEVIGAICLAALILLICSQIIARGFFGFSAAWVPELAQWLFVTLVLVTLPITQKRDSYLSFSNLQDALPSVLQYLARMIVDVVTLYTLGRLGINGGQIIALVGGVNPALGIPEWVPFVPVAISAACTAILYIYRAATQGHYVRISLSILLVAIWLALDILGLILVPQFRPGFFVLGSFAAALALGVPVSIAMLFASFIAGDITALIPGPAVVQNVVRGLDRFILLAIPLFLFTGALMNLGGLTTRLIDLADSLVGHFRGGLAQVSVLSAMLYGGISGSSNAEASLGAKLLVPQMMKRGYPAPFACAITSAAAILPNVIPPSIAMLILAAASDISVGALFIGGIIPGIILTIFLMVTVYFQASRLSIEEATVPRPLPGRALWRALPLIGLAIIIVGGIRLGWATPTEAGALAVLYVFILGMMMRVYSRESMLTALKETALDAGLIGLLIGVAAPFSFILIADQIPQDLLQILPNDNDNRWIGLLMMNLLMLVAGLVMDTGAAILVLVPLLLPAAVQLGIDPVHFGVMTVINLMIGGLTPPVGILVFITATTARQPVDIIFRAVRPFTLVLILALLIIAFVPELTLGLGHLLHKGN